MNKAPRKITRIDQGTKSSKDLKVPFANLEPKRMNSTVNPDLTQAQLQQLQKILQAEVYRGARPTEDPVEFLYDQDQAISNLKDVEAKLSNIEFDNNMQNRRQSNEEIREKMFQSYGMEKQEYVAPPQDTSRPGIRDDFASFQENKDKAENKGWGEYSNRSSGVSGPKEMKEALKKTMRNNPSQKNPRLNVPKK